MTVAKLLKHGWLHVNGSLTDGRSNRSYHSLKTVNLWVTLDGCAMYDSGYLACKSREEGFRARLTSELET